MEIENLSGHWPNVAINQCCVNCTIVQKLANAEKEIKYLRKVCQTQAGSFAAIENENTVLRSKLNRIRELAERLQDA